MDSPLVPSPASTLTLDFGLPAGSGVEAMHRRKRLGQFFTPSRVAGSLVSWLELAQGDRLLDPSCGDGQFLRWHKRSVGIEIDPENAGLARQAAPSALVHGGDFFAWAQATKERFAAVCGNPPFIRYQNFAGEMRDRALASAKRHGADFSALSSSWAPFLIVASSLLAPGGKMAFVVPAEIGHASYARPLIRALCVKFGTVQVVACREKLFPALSEDCWLLFCSGFGQSTQEIALTLCEEFEAAGKPPPVTRLVSLLDWESMGARLRPFLLPAPTLGLYRGLVESASVARLGRLATSSVGYVTGGNDFFHLRPSDVSLLNIPAEFLRVAIRKADQLPPEVVDDKVVSSWYEDDRPVLLLHLPKAHSIPQGVQAYLDSKPGQEVRESYKCRARDPWYSVPAVVVPDAFLSVMSGERPFLVRNQAGCVCTNTLHAVRFRKGVDAKAVQTGWKSQLSILGAEIEGHPLGGGMLKIEPREAARVPVPLGDLELTPGDSDRLERAVRLMRRWRHYG